MSEFPDTSFLCALYRTQENSLLADTSMAGLTGPLSVSSLLLLEFRQSVRLQIRLHKQDRTRGFSGNEGGQMMHDLQSDLTNGTLAVVPVDWADVHRWAEQLSARYTPDRGCRFADILHVATALHLGLTTFLTFDNHQKGLAQAEGLQVPF